MTRSLAESFFLKTGKSIDKWEQYLGIYEREFGRFLGEGRPIALLEIGVQNGGSLELWGSYLPLGSTVIGLDIDPKVGALVFDNPNVKAYVVDGTKADAVQDVLGAQSFDVIIDDGSHTSSDIIASFKALFDRLRPGGLYIVEDLHCSYYATHEGGFRGPGTSIEWLKRIVEAVNFDHLDRGAVDPVELIWLSEMNKSIAGISFYDSVAVVEKFAVEKQAPFRRLLSGTVGAIVPNVDWVFLQSRQSLHTMLLGGAAARSLSADLLSLIETTRNENARVKDELAIVQAGAEALAVEAEARVVEAEARAVEAENGARKAIAQRAELEAAVHAGEAAMTSLRTDLEHLQQQHHAERDSLKAALTLAHRRLAVRSEDARASSELLDRAGIEADLPLQGRVQALLTHQEDVFAALADLWALLRREDIRLSGLSAGRDIAERRLAGALAVIAELRARFVDESHSRAARAARRLRRLNGRGATDDRTDLSRVDAAVAALGELDQADLEILARREALDTAYYLDANSDLLEAGVDPVAHYFAQGVLENRRPHANFDAQWYIDHNPDVAKSGLNPLVHYALHGAAENRPTMPGAGPDQRATAFVLRMSGLFDEAYYRDRYAGVIPPDADALMHFLETGARDGFDPSASFSMAAYLEDNPDIAAAGTNPLLHYALHGRREGRPVRAPVRTDADQDARASEADLIRSSGLFDPDWYASHYPDAPPDADAAWLHFVRHGRFEGRQPNPGFDPLWYAGRYPDTGGPSEALLHYIRHGAAEGRRPSETFDAAWYAMTYPDVPTGQEGALAHYVRHGRAEGRRPRGLDTIVAAHGDRSSGAGLFDAQWYMSRYPDVPREAEAAWQHFRDRGYSEGRLPNAYFDPAWYAARYADVGEPTDAFWHYVALGATGGRDPSNRFDAAWYLYSYPDVASSPDGPLGHYLRFGRAEGRKIRDVQASPGAALDRLIARYREAGDIQAETLLAMRKDGLHATLDRFAPYRPINVYLDAAKRNDPVVYVVLPSIRLEHATGGPNTAFILGCELAARDIPVVFLSTSAGPDEDLSLIKGHLEKITGFDIEALPVGFATAHDDARALGIGENDLFLATAWWTAQAASSAAKLCRQKSIYYLIQDYESTFYGASALYTLADSSYNINCRPIINTSLLRDHLAEEKVGRFRDPGFSAAALVFEPAIDANLFHAEPRGASGVRTLLFYARPTKAERNLFPNGVAALRSAIAQGAFDGDDWQFVGMGEAFEPVPLGNGHVLTPSPWLGMDAYAELMRQADLLLSLMLSPHPSYPPLEMASCGGVVVTTTYGSKTADRLAAISPLIIAVEPQVEDLGRALCTAAALVRNREGLERSGTTSFPRTWAESLGGVVSVLSDEIRDLWKAVERGPWLPPAVTIVRDGDEIPDSPAYYVDSARHRRSLYGSVPRSKSFSLITTVYDTDPSFVSDLARTVFVQDPSVDYEWLILDNGSNTAATRDVLAEVARHPRVRLERTPVNLGIVGGMKWCLDNARGDYVLPVDSDDLLFSDCLRTIAATCDSAGYPAILYTDEDKTEELHPRDPYLKPDWDPVLFFHSCFVAHLTVIDRRAALELGCYTDNAAEGCHDWDTFTRFFSAGHEPLHIPEILYSWRMHFASTAGNYRSKPYVYKSHHAVLNRFLVAQEKGDDYDIRLAPLFDGTPDYQFVRRKSAEALGLFAPGAVQRLDVQPAMTRVEILRAALAIPDGVAVVHLRNGLGDADEEASLAEALTLLDLFPDTVIVGGRIHDGRVVLEGGYVFGYSGVVGCPDAGRALGDPGYFAQSWKPRSVGAVTARHCYVRRDFFIAAAAELPNEIEVGMLGPWLGAIAREAGGRVICSPYVTARGRAPAASPTDFEAALFSRRFPSLAGDVTGYARHLDRSGLRPFTPNRETTVPRLPGYAAFLDAALASRGRDWPVGAGGVPTISILTTVYIKTSASLFEETVMAVRRQSHQPLEWLVLAHGPITEELEAALSRVALEGLLTVLREEVNLGIQGGLRRCLEAASGDFVLSLDADDLLTRDAIQILTAAVVRDPSATILYSDEDLLIEGQPKHPFYRPDFDPVLLTGTSFIWHAILFRRDVGLRIGAYTSAAAEYAQDWDVLVRFHAAGHQPMHVPAVLYHWRQHESSLSNSGTLFEGSVRSVHGVLARLCDASPIADRLRIADYPTSLGQASYYLEREPADAPPVHVVRLPSVDLSRSRLRQEAGIDLPNARWSDAEASTIEAVERAGREGPEAFVLLISSAVQTVDMKGYWQALKHLEMHPSCVAVGGPLLDKDARISRGPLVAVNGRLVDEGGGRLWSDPGSFSLGLQAHAVTAIGPDILLIRREALSDLLAAGLPRSGLGGFALWLARRAHQRGEIVVYEPLFRARVEAGNVIGHSSEMLNLGLRSNEASRVVSGQLRGLAGFIGAKEMHS